jgi:hypothetical protein
MLLAQAKNQFDYVGVDVKKFGAATAGEELGKIGEIEVGGRETEIDFGKSFESWRSTPETVLDQALIPDYDAQHEPLFSSEFARRYPRTAGYLRIVFAFSIVICAAVGAYRIVLFIGVDHEWAALIAVVFGASIIADDAQRY